MNSYIKINFNNISKNNMHRIDNEIDEIIRLNKKLDLIKDTINSNKNINYDMYADLKYNYFNINLKNINLENECPVCYNKEINNYYNKLDCNHYLCNICYQSWKDKCINNKICFHCPICRQNIL